MLVKRTFRDLSYYDKRDLQQVIQDIEDRLFDRGWVRFAMATRKCGNIYFRKYFMAYVMTCLDTNELRNCPIHKCVNELSIALT